MIALNSDEAVIAIDVAKFPNTFSSPSGFHFGSPRDKDDYGIYAVYPREEWYERSSIARLLSISRRFRG